MKHPKIIEGAPVRLPDQGQEFPPRAGGFRGAGGFHPARVGFVDAWRML